jgi:transposase
MITNIRIKESSEELKKLLSKEKNKKARVRLHIIYLLKTRKVIDAKELSKIMMLDDSSITRLLNLYRKGGLKNLLNIKTSPGRPSKIGKDVIELLKLELGKSKGFNNIKEIMLWLRDKYNLECTYRQVHHLVKKKLKASPKVVRPSNPKKDDEKVEEFKKKDLKKK